MNATSGLAGIWAATITPVDASLRPDAPKAIEYYRELLQDGCDGLNLMGTTGEAMSFSAGERERFMIGPLPKVACRSAASWWGRAPRRSPTARF